MMSIEDRRRMRALREARNDRDRVAQRVLPLEAFYGRGEDLEARRNRFYDSCAKVFRWQGWDAITFDMDYEELATVRDAPMPLPGHGGRGREIAAIERNRTVAINLNSAPFEWMASHSMLESKADQAGIGNIRFSAGIKFRDLMVGAEPAGLKSANLEGGSGGGGVPVLISDFKVDCIHTLSGIRRELAKSQPLRTGRLRIGESEKIKKKYRGKLIEGQYAGRHVAAFELLSRLIYQDEWVFEKLSKAQQKAVVNQIHNGLDQVAMYFGMITKREFVARWAKSKPA